MEDKSPSNGSKIRFYLFVTIMYLIVLYFIGWSIRAENTGFIRGYFSHHMLAFIGIGVFFGMVLRGLVSVLLDPDKSQ